MAFVPKPPFPNVPRLPGVPQVRRSPLFPANPGPVIGTAVALGRLWEALTAPITWGVFRQQDTQTDAAGVPTVTVRGNLQPVITADSVLDFGYRNEYDVADYPLQDGAFANYNKVALPYEASVRFAKGGTKEERREFLNQLEDILVTTELFYILTPERTYVDVNPVRLEVVRRGAGGAYFLTEVDLFFREIRSVQPQYTNTAVATQNAQNPSAQPVDNNGTVAGERPNPVPAITDVVNE